MKQFFFNLAVSLVGDPNSTGGSEINIPSPNGETILHNGLNIAYFLGGTIAVIVIIIGGIMYITAAGNSGSVTKAKNMILYAIVGLIVIIAAFAITNFVIVGFN